MDKDFITVLPDSGGGSAQLRVDAAENLDAGARQTEITISGGGVTKKVSITQKAYRTQVVARIDPASYTFPPQGGTKEFKCTCVREFYDADGVFIKSEPLVYNVDWEITETMYLGSATINPNTQVVTVTAEPAASDLEEEVGAIEIYSMEDGSYLTGMNPMIQPTKTLYIQCYDQPDRWFVVCYENNTTQAATPIDLYVFASVEIPEVGWLTERIILVQGQIHNEAMLDTSHTGFDPEGISDFDDVNKIKQELSIGGYKFIFVGNGDISV